MKRLVSGLLITCLPAMLALPQLWAGDSAASGDDEGRGALRVMAYNIRAGLGMDKQRSLERVARVIEKFKPDLVALQEVDRNCKRSGGIDMAAKLGEILGMEHRFGKFMDLEGGEYGLAVLSRLPIAKTLRHQLPDGAEPRCALEVQVELEAVEAPLSFISIHNDWTSADYRRAQAEALLKAIDSRSNPVILAGDFNGNRDDPSVKLIAGSRFKLPEKKGARRTWPAGKPRIEIDFIMMRNIRPRKVEHWVIDERLASDHRPVAATVQF